jgi:hypothetical protein
MSTKKQKPAPTFDDIIDKAVAEQIDDYVIDNIVDGIFDSNVFYTFIHNKVKESLKKGAK